MITMLDIAKRSGISRYTISKVLNGNPSVRPATREKVLAACRKYGYIPDSAAVGLVKGHTNLIGVTVPYLTDDFYSEFIEKLDRIAPVRGYQLIYRSSYNDGATEAAILRSFLSLKVCGLIVVPVVRGADPAIHRLAARRVPVVYFDRPLDGEQYCVLNDNREGTFRMTKLLLEKGRRPSYLGSFYRESNITAVRREQGYCEAMTAAGLEPDCLDVVAGGELQDNERFGYENTVRRLAGGRVPDALLCVTDAVALGAMRALSEAGIRPGADVPICGHDNLRFSEFTTPSLSTVRQRKDLFADTCIDILDRSLHGDPPERREYIFSPELILRESTP